jgi:putative ABC transport system permease protein
MRRLFLQPGYVAGCVLTLAVAIGASSAIFGVVHGVILKPLPIRNPGELVVSWEEDRARNLAVVELTYRSFEYWASHAKTLANAAAVGSSTWPDVLTSGGDPARVATAGVSASFLDTLGVRPELGRGFSQADDQANAPPVTIVSHAFWTRRFGSDPAIVGQMIELDDRREVIGVMPRDFDCPRGTDFWIPVVPVLAKAGGTRLDGLRDIGVLFAIGRLRPGVSPAAATQELETLASQAVREGATVRFGSSVVVTPFLDHVLGSLRPALWAALAAVGVLVLIACANVSGLMLTRARRRMREYVIQRALGASSGRLARQWMSEALLLAVAGGVLGLLGAHWIIKAIVALAPPGIPRLADVAINLPVAAFAFGAPMTAALLCGVSALRHATGGNLPSALADVARSTPGPRSTGARSALLSLQVALAVVLLVAAGLIVQSFVNLGRIDLGFAPSNVIAMDVSPRHAGRPTNEWMAELIERISRLPDVEDAGAVFLRPLALGAIGQETDVVLEGQSDSPEIRRRNPALNAQVATPGYFRAMRIPLLGGRFFTAEDRANADRVAVVSESAARRLWPGADPIGRKMLMPTHGPNRERAWRTVVGVVADVRYRGLTDARLDVYDAAAQSPLDATDLVVRTRGDLGAVSLAVQAEACRLDPGVVIDRVTSMDAILGRATSPWRLSVWIFTLFGVIAFAIATVGLISVVGLDVAEQRREFAIRLALGADRRHVVGLALRSAGLWAVLGVAGGVVTALAASRALGSLLFDVTPVDPVTYAVVVALVVSVVAVASYLPARRAADVDPMTLFR